MCNIYFEKIFIYCENLPNVSVIVRRRDTYRSLNSRSMLNVSQWHPLIPNNWRKVTISLGNIDFGWCIFLCSTRDYYNNLSRAYKIAFFLTFNNFCVECLKNNICNQSFLKVLFSWGFLKKTFLNFLLACSVNTICSSEFVNLISKNSSALKVRILD